MVNSLFLRQIVTVNQCGQGTMNYVMNTRHTQVLSGHCSLIPFEKKILQYIYFVFHKPRSWVIMIRSSHTLYDVIATGLTLRHNTCKWHHKDDITKMTSLVWQHHIQTKNQHKQDSLKLHMYGCVWNCAIDHRNIGCVWLGGCRRFLALGI